MKLFFSVLTLLSSDYGCQGQNETRGIHFAPLAHRVGWVKRDVGKIYVGCAYLVAPQKFEITTKLANLTRLITDCRLNPI